MSFPDDGEIKAPKGPSGAAYSTPTARVRIDPEQMALFKAEILGALKPKEDLGPTFNAFHERFLREYARAERQKPRGIESKESILRNHILPRFGDRQLGSLVPEDIALLKAGMSKHATKTVNNVLTVLAKMLRVAVEWKAIPRVPVEIRLLKTMAPTPRFYEFEEYAHLINCAMQLDMRKWAMVLLAGDAGLRLGEIIGLDWPNVDFRRGDHGQIHVVQSISRGMLSAPKGGRDRWVPMSSRLEAALQGVFSMLTLTRRPTGAVLRRDSGGRVTDKVIHNWMAQVQRAAELDDRGDIHILRHTFCSHHAMRGVAPRTIQELAGHASIRTTERYMHLSPSEKSKAIAMLNSPSGNGTPDGSVSLEWRRRESNPVPERPSSGSLVESPKPRRRRKAASRRPETTDALTVLRDALDEEAGGGGE